MQTNLGGISTVVGRNAVDLNMLTRSSSMNKDRPMAHTELDRAHFVVELSSSSKFN